jgi:hypothetical protein
MSVRSQQQITLAFSTPLGSGAAANATVGPTGTLFMNGVSTAAVVTITGLATGIYSAGFTLPFSFIGDVVQLEISATTNAVAEKKIVWSDAVDIALDEEGGVNASKINGNANAAAVLGALFDMGFAGISNEPPVGMDFAFQETLDTPSPPSAGWLIFYLGEPRRIETYDVGTLSGTTDRPFSTVMEGGNPMIVLPAYSPVEIVAPKILRIVQAKDD